MIGNRVKYFYVPSLHFCIIGSTTVYTFAELQKATDSFAENTIIGRVDLVSCLKERSDAVVWPLKN